MECESSIALISKYAEGDYLRRYYSNCQLANEIEETCIQQLKELTGMEYANVQPYSGSIANLAVYLSFLNIGDRILSFDLGCGGHLTHGAGGSFSGKYFNVLNYGVDRKTELIDYNEIEQKALQFKPKLIVVGSSSYSRQIDFEKIKNIADKVGARVLADMAHYIGLILADLYPKPFEYVDYVTFTTHKTFKGPRGAIILCKREYAKDIDLTVFPLLQGGPFVHAIAGKLVAAFQHQTVACNQYQHRVIINSATMCNVFQNRGISIVSGGTSSHVFIAKTESFDKTGKDCEDILEECGIYVNRNLIPFDDKSSDICSGIRIGTPFITSLGATDKDCANIANLICDLLTDKITQEEAKSKQHSLLLEVYENQNIY